jgi:UDP:flavonoid glycosyltransferase YjiC (YdhE family)
MRILFCAAPAGGHLFPMLPLAHAAADAGDEVAILTGHGGAAFVPGWTVFEHGPSMAEALARTAEIFPGEDGTQPGAATIELFGGIRVEGAAADGALDAARSFTPDLIVAEAFDQVGPFISSVLGVPHVVHALTGPVPPEMLAAIADRADAVITGSGAVRAPRTALVDPYPEILLALAERSHATDRLPIRPAVHAEKAEAPPFTPGAEGRPRVLVSMGTVVTDLDVIRPLADAAVRVGAEAIVTTPREVPADGQDRAHERWVGFSPLSELLPHVDAVISAGGTGTVLAALSAGVPLVIHPLLADQPWNARRLQERGVAVTVDDVRDAENAVRSVLADDRYRTSARELESGIRALPTAGDVLVQLRSRIARPDASAV